MTEYVGKTAYRGEIAARYDADRQKEPLWAEEQEFVRRWVRRLPAGAIVLDLPVGTGRFLPVFAAQGLQVRGRDISADMVAEARRQHGGLSGVELAVGDAEQLDLPDQSVDAVVCWRFFHLIPESLLARTLFEFRRVSRGPVVVQVLQARLPDRSSRWWRACKDLIRPWWQRRRPAPIQPWSHITSFSHADSVLRAHFHAAGFVVESAERMGDSSGQPVMVYTLHW